MKYQKRAEIEEILMLSNLDLALMLQDRDIAKIVLVTLYMCEGTKNGVASVVFCNSDPVIIKLFLHLLRTVYAVEETKMRCTVYFRADQDETVLKKYWSTITGIPLGQFYDHSVDKRTIGKKTMKKEYKGVCRIDYFSSLTFYDIMATAKVVMGS